MGQFRNIIMTQQQEAEKPYIVLPYCYFNESPVPTDILVSTSWTELKLSLSVDTDAFVFGARSSSSATDKLEIRAVTSVERFNTTIGTNSAAYSYVTDLADRTDLTIDGSNITTVNNGTTDTVSVGTTTGFVACPYPVCFGGIQTSTSVTSTLRMKGYFWGCEIKINNVLTHQIIPVKMKADDSICLYDTKTDKYYTPLSGTTLLEEKPAPTPVDDGIFKFTVDMQYNTSLNCYLTISGASDYTVDWGDGTSVQTGQSMHTYSTIGQYQIKVTKGTNFPSLKLSQLAEVISIDTPLPYMNSVTNLSGFAISCTHLTTIPENLFYFNSQITSLQSCFLGCTSLVTLPNKLLEPLINVTNMVSAFEGATGLISIPSGFFDKCISLTRLYKCFKNCTNLVTIPDLLFDKNSMLYDFVQCFYGCTMLTIPTNLFCDDSTDRTTRFASVSGMDFDSCFMRNSYTGSATMTVPALWDYTFTGTPGRWGCYGGAGNSSTNITNYSSIPNPWNAS